MFCFLWSMLDTLGDCIWSLEYWRRRHPVSTYYYVFRLCSKRANTCHSQHSEVYEKQSMTFSKMRKPRVLQSMEQCSALSPYWLPSHLLSLTVRLDQPLLQLLAASPASWTICRSSLPPPLDKLVSGEFVLNWLNKRLLFRRCLWQRCFGILILCKITTQIRWLSDVQLDHSFWLWFDVRIIQNLILSRSGALSGNQALGQRVNFLG